MSVATNENAPGCDPEANQKNTISTNFTAQGPSVKEFSTVRAKLALKGHTLTEAKYPDERGWKSADTVHRARRELEEAVSFL